MTEGRGLFITIEGGDGAGKTTQIDNITRFFEERGLVVMHTREPGSTRISEKLRDIVLDKNNIEMEPVTEMLIYSAARSQLVREKIIPALERGEIVICDRYVDSSIAYQGYGRGLGDMVAEVNARATGGLEPDITFWLDIDPKAGKARASKRALNGAESAAEPGLDRLELEEMDFHYRVREGYSRLAEQYPERVKRIDASRSVEEIKREIYEYLEELCK